MILLLAAATSVVAMDPAAAADSFQPVDSFRPLATPAQRERAAALRTRGLAAEGYIWGVPAFLNFGQATEFKAARAAAAPGEEPFGSWLLLRDLATPAIRNVMPNVDTLYGMSFILLDRQGPVILEVPAAPGRYFSVALLDAYFNAFAVLGSHQAGETPTRILVVPPGWAGMVPEAIDQVLHAPTSCISAVQRVFVAGPSDLPAARALQDRITLAPAGGGRFPAIATPEYDAAPGLRRTTDPFRFFETVSDYALPSSQFLIKLNKKNYMNCHLSTSLISAEIKNH
jgi:hypothetical protein